MAYHFALADSFDLLTAEVYADDVLIQNTLVSRDGSQKLRVMPVPYYKAVIRSSIAMARELGDY